MKIEALRVLNGAERRSGLPQCGGFDAGPMDNPDCVTCVLASRNSPLICCAANEDAVGTPAANVSFDGPQRSIPHW